MFTGRITLYGGVPWPVAVHAVVVVYEVCAFSSLLYVIFALIYRHIVLCVSHQSTVILIALL